MQIWCLSDLRVVIRIFDFLKLAFLIVSQLPRVTPN